MVSMQNGTHVLLNNVRNVNVMMTGPYRKHSASKQGTYYGHR